MRRGQDPERRKQAGKRKAAAADAGEDEAGKAVAEEMDREAKA